MPRQTVAVFGGTGFLGRRIVRHLLDRGAAVRVASRHPDRCRVLFPARDAALEAIHADVNHDRSVAAAVGGVQAVVNAVSLYVERGRQTFQSVHVDAARRVADHARRAGAGRLAHLSGIGADEGSGSPYVRCRGLGETVVRGAFPAATIVRPAVMFGPDDAFLVPLRRLLRRLPVFPMFGRGLTRLQPAHVDDVAEAIVRILQGPEPAIAYELGGPRIYTYEALLRTVAEREGVRPRLVPLPFGIWHALAHAAEALPNPPLTRGQVELMRLDTVAAAGCPGFAALDMTPRTIEDMPAAMAEHG